MYIYRWRAHDILTRRHQHATYYHFMKEFIVHDEQFQGYLRLTNGLYVRNVTCLLLVFNLVCMLCMYIYNYPYYYITHTKTHTLFYTHTHTHTHLLNLEWSWVTSKCVSMCWTAFIWYMDGFSLAFQWVSHQLLHRLVWLICVLAWFTTGAWLL